MRRLLRHAPIVILVIAGLTLLLMYAVSVDWRDRRDPGARDVAAAAGFGLALIAGAALLVAGRTRAGSERGARFPAGWVGGGVLVVAVVVGVGAARWDWLPAAEPLVAVAGLAGLFSAGGRLVTRWSPAGSVASQTVARATVWGMFLATGAALVLQLMLAAAAIGAVLAGLALVDTRLVGDFGDVVAEQGTLDELSGDIVRTLTVALGISAMYAVVAPLTEEFTKLVGVAVVLRGTAASAFQTFVAGVCVGLGFAVVETLGYALAAGSAWQWLLLVRAPVAFIHVTATALASYGLYRQRTRGGYRLVPWFVAAVIVHGAWNGLTVAAMLLSTEVDPAGSTSAVAILLVLGVVGLLALVLTASIAWTTLTARTLGRAVAMVGRSPVDAGQPRRQVPVVLFERSEVRGIGS